MGWGGRLECVLTPPWESDRECSACPTWKYLDRRACWDRTEEVHRWMKAAVFHLSWDGGGDI